MKEREWATVLWFACCFSDWKIQDHVIERSDNVDSVMLTFLSHYLRPQRWRLHGQYVSDTCHQDVCVVCVFVRLWLGVFYCELSGLYVCTSVWDLRCCGFLFLFLCLCMRHYVLVTHLYSLVRAALRPSMLVVQKNVIHGQLLGGFLSIMNDSRMT